MKAYELTEVIEEQEVFNELMDSLVLSSMRANYLDFVQVYGCELASERMEALYKETWKKHREVVWQWFDLEMKDLRDKA
jgi:hypothetical protein